MDTSIRNCRESGLTVQKPQYLGIFPVKFPKGRHDITLCMTAKYISGEPKPTRELSRYIWASRNDITKIRPIRGNYQKMLRAWRTIKHTNTS